MLAAVTGSRVPLHLLIVLCLACFFAGRFWQSSELLPDLRYSAVQKDVRTLQSLNTESLPAHQTASDSASDGEDAGDADSTADSVADSGSIEDTEDVDYLFPLKVDDATYPGPNEMQQLLQIVGLADKRPLSAIGATGARKYYSIPFQLLSWEPRIVLLPNFLSKWQCGQLLKWAQTEAQSVEDGGDDSDGMVLGPFGSDADGIIEFMSERLAAFSRLPTSLQETMRMYRFKTEKETVGYPPNWQTEKTHLANLQVFLSEPEQGGDVVFPYAGKGGADRKLKDNDGCVTPGAYRVPVRQGDALLIWRLDYRGEIDQASEHWTCPIKGATDKYIAVYRVFPLPPE